MANYGKLNGRVIEMFGTRSKFAETVGQDYPTVCKKLNGAKKITTRDIEAWIGPLQITPDEIGIYFFN